MKFPILAVVLLLAAPFALPESLALPDETAKLEPRIQAALETIDAEDAFAYISFLAADALRGRNAGTEGNDEAAEWIADFFEEMGLQGGGPEGSFFKTFTFRARGKGGGEQRTQNVIAIWPGSDPALRDEAVVIGAHFDHVGRYGQDSNPARLGKAQKDDLVWNGADDNASGTSAVMELAQAFALARVPARRSVVFVCFSAEEHGLFGSWDYVKNPPIPLEKTSAMINLDMIGRNPERPVMIFGLKSDEERFMEACLDEISRLILPVEFRASDGAFGGSDHWPFLKKGVPAAFFFSGFHRDYHRITDEPEKISGERVQHVARAAFLLAYKIANRDARLMFDPEMEEQLQAGRNRRMLGIDLGRKVDDLSRIEGLGLPDNQGAVRVAGVYKGSTAHTAGVKTGDLVLAIGKVMVRKKEALSSLREAIQSAPGDTEVPIMILRGREIITLQAVWKSEKKSGK
jgi:hypothetical protein